MKYCYNCGNKLKKGDIVCGKCGIELTDNKKEIKDAKVVEEKEVKKEIEEVEEVKEEEKENTTSSTKGSYRNENIKTSNVVNSSDSDEDVPVYLCIASLVCSFILPWFLPVKILYPLIGLGLMIFVRVTYPNNTFGKVLMWIDIIAYTLAILFIILVVVACSKTCGALGKMF